MKPTRRFFRRLAALFVPRDEARLQQEIDEHVTLQTADNLRRGMSPVEARRQAALEFGAVESIKEDYRDQRGIPFLETLFQDTRHALRRLRKAPVFALTTIVTLALGIGATTAIFTLVHAVLLKSLPVSNPDQLYRLGNNPRCCMEGGYNQGREFSIVSYPLYEHFRDHTDGFEELAAFQADETPLGVRRAKGGNAAQSFLGEFVSGNYFAMFGVKAYAGRALTAADDRPGAAAAAMLSYRVWQEKYGLDSSVIGAVFNLNEKPFTVVGITPPGFYGDTLRATPPDFFLPLATEPLVQDDQILQSPADHWLDLIGRARANTNPQSIQAQMRVELQQWLRSHSSEMDPNDRITLAQQTVNLAPGGGGITSMRAQYAHWLQILMMVSGFVLFIVCANVANLMLVRGMERRQQTALSMALGARPSRLVRQAMTESLVLSLLGGAAGLAIAFAGTRVILHFAFENMAASPVSASPSLPILLFALGISLLTGIIFGIAPAWMALRADPMEALRGVNRATRQTGSLPRKSLVILQAALSLVLLSASGLLTKALLNLQNQDFGFEQNDRVVINIDPVLAGYKPMQMEPLYRRIYDSLESVPGVWGVAFCNYSPLSGGSWNQDVLVEGRPAPGPNEDNEAGYDWVSAEYFDTIGTPVFMGRAIHPQDTATSRPVAVINEAFARKFFGKENPIGRHFGGNIKTPAEFEIVGVVKDARYSTHHLQQPVGAFAFLPASQSRFFLHDIIIRMQPGMKLSEAQVSRAIAGVDPNMPVLKMQTLSDQVTANYNQPRFIAQLTSLFGILALMLASIGLYGVTAYNAGSRTNEIGVRMALGAGRGSVLALILRGALALIACGLLLGLPLAVVAGRILGSQLYGINPFDPLIFGAAILALGFSALIAAFIPAVRASSILPLEALRTE